MLSIKPGVTLLGLQPQMIVALIAAHAVYDKLGVELVITAGNDGTHSETSEHYGGRALDLRTRDIVDPASVAKDLSERLGRDYHVLFEGDHLHVAYRPKRAQA